MSILGHATDNFKRVLFVFAVLFVLNTTGPVKAMSSGGPGGTWPKSWPKQLEPLRKQAWTWVHGLVMRTSYDISFTSREQFEAAWPHLLAIKSQGAAITLKRGSHVRVFSLDSPDSAKKRQSAGVIVLPPLKSAKTGPLSVTQIVLVVDGDIVDLNRIPLPPDTPIIDQRFKNVGKNRAQKKIPSVETQTAEVTVPAVERKPGTEKNSE